MRQGVRRETRGGVLEGCLAAQSGILPSPPETARRRRAVDPEGTSDLAFLSHVSADKLRETARRSAQRALNNELLEARLDAWPLWRVLREVRRDRGRARAPSPTREADEIYITPEAEAEAAATYEVRAEENVRAAEAERDDAQRRGGGGGGGGAEGEGEGGGG